MQPGVHVCIFVVKRIVPLSKTYAAISSIELNTKFTENDQKYKHTSGNVHACCMCARVTIVLLNIYLNL